ncbi:MAG: CPBP family intramembrane metalloprotease [Candidatus Obscuribacterales bacterium]|nr:CPBP family intramembrane metalloprotease [Candidatus Obscuribacterales bacterium]
MNNSEISRQTLLSLTITIEALLLLTATAWRFFGNIQLAPSLALSREAVIIGVLVGLGIAAVSWFCYFLGKYLRLFSGLRKFSKNFLAPLVLTLSWQDIIIMSLVSGFCEEILFRGIMQKETNLFTASIAFGIFHDPSLQQKTYVLSAMIAGLVLGMAYMKTGNLWTPIIAHILHNAISLLLLRYQVKPES